MALVIWTLVIVSSIWVYIDAKKLGVRKGLIKGMLDLSPVAWGFCTLLLWIVAFPAYLAMRPQYKKLANN